MAWRIRWMKGRGVIYRSIVELSRRDVKRKFNGVFTQVLVSSGGAELQEENKRAGPPVQGSRHKLHPSATPTRFPRAGHLMLNCLRGAGQYSSTIETSCRAHTVHRVATRETFLAKPNEQLDPDIKYSRQCGDNFLDVG